jgi:hypothetical protein
MSWWDCCGFSVIFRTFKLAVHPGKLILAAGGLLLTWLVGIGLDAIWSAGGATVYSGEIRAYVTDTAFGTWRAERARADDEALASLMVEREVAPSLAQARRDLEQDRRAALGKLRERIDQWFEPRMNLEDRRILENERIGKLPQDQQEAEREKLHERLPSMVAQSRAEYRALLAEIEDYGNQHVFGEWVTNQLHFARAALNGLLSGNLAGRADPPPQAVSHPVNPFRPDSFLGALGCMVGALCWMMRMHPVYGLIFAVLNLVIWSVFGGALCRMAALDAARDKKISIGQALSFSTGKWREFCLAPVIPVIFLMIVGLLLWLGGFGTAIPLVGEIIGPLLFPMALLGGFVIALVFIGTIAGGALMWPTVAAEGSDSFDAISRSFSYVYNRPWRSAFYALLLCVYGSLCYLFVRFFVWLMLACTHVFVSAGVGLWADRPEAGLEMNKFNVMWAAPTFDDLRPHFDMVNLSGAEPFGAVVIWVFVSLLVLAMHAFVISFALNGFTGIYLLLRRVVDATDLEDVYTEDFDREEIETVPEKSSEPPASSATADSGPEDSAPPPPPAEPSEGGAS